MDLDMACDICARDFAAKRRPLCASCANAILYERRVQQATALLDRESSHTHAEAVIRPGNDGVLASLPNDADFDAITGGIKRHSTDRAQADTEAVNNRIDRILDKAAELKRNIEDYKTGAAAQKDDIDRRRKELAAERIELEKHKPRALDPVRSTTNKTVQRLEKIRSRIIDCRLLLCREATAASNFQRRKGTNGRSEYTLGGIAIPDLRDLNKRTQPLAKPALVGGRTVAEPHELVSEAIENVARLLNISAHYMSIRLPAEMILPHEDFPRTVVMPEKSSYRFKNIRFPGISSSQSSSSTASRVVEGSRTIWLNGPLSQLLKDDAKSFALYVEGVMLLACNVAWLCKIQGIDNINTFEDVCAVGRNLWQLLMTQHRKSQRPPLDRRGTQTSAKEDAEKGIRVGVFSHNSAHMNLASAQGVELMRDGKVVSATRLIDALEKILRAEINGAEWHLVEEREWDEEREEERPVFVGGSRRPNESINAAMSIMSVAPHDRLGDDRASGSASEGKRKGSSGWMKVRGRTGDTG